MPDTAGPSSPDWPFLDERVVAADPIEQFQRWMADAVDANVPMPEAMTLATATADGRPSARMVLLKGVDQNGFTFFTNYRSRKAQELAANPRAALVVYWADLERQVRVEGTVARTTADESTEYFATRPLDSQLSAWASPQSEVLPNRQALEARFEDARRRFPDGRVPCPEYWGGFRLRPEAIEFWQGRPGRLHDRLLYLRVGHGWTIQRLAP